LRFSFTDAGLSRSKKKSHSGSESHAGPQSPGKSKASFPEESAVPDVDQPAGTSTRILIALGVAAVWYVILISLATTTANSVILNSDQISSAHCIVLATVDETGKAEIKKCWKMQMSEKSVQLSDFKFANGKKYPPGEYLIPLSRTRVGFEITKSRVKNNTRLVYPASEELIEALEAMLQKKRAVSNQDAK
jgi:hypothetical protein